MTPRNSFTYTTELGSITITEEDGFITEVLFGDFGYNNANTPLTDLTADQIREYLSGSRTAFTVPFRQDGSDFDQLVWQLLRTIPAGQRRTYSELAETLSRPKAARAVGNACGRNRIAILIHCHRVVRSDGSPGGYAWGAEIKHHLLELEKLYTAK